MKHKIIKLTVTFLVLFSLQGFSQTTETSKHPLLDKYYPQKQDADTSNTPPVNPVTEIKPAPKSPEISPVAPAKPVMTTTAPAIPTSTPAISTSTHAITSTTPTMTTSTTVEKPAALTIQTPQTQKVVTPPPSLPYRLGSSTKQYDTWEKNNNGAGTVTTSTK